MSETKTAAKAGDSRAQYVLAAHLRAAGRADEAERWLQSAAQNGEPDALYTLATRELRSIAGVSAAASLLDQASEGGSAPARRLRALLRAEGLGRTADWGGACDEVLALAAAGNPAALCEIAGLLFLVDPLDADGAALLNRAAADDAVAAAVLVRRASLGRPGATRALAEAALGFLTGVNYPRAAALSAALKAAPAGPCDAAAASADLEAVARKIRAVIDLPAPQPAALSHAPAARLAQGAFAPEALDYVIGHAALRLAPSMTTDSRTGEVRRDEYRSSLTATLGPVDQDLVIAAICRRMAQIAHADWRHAEFLSVLRYAPGQEYRPHFDWLAPGPDFDRGGQRVRTALLYLNADYGGGETVFTETGLSVKGAPGDVLVFDNVRADGSGDRASRHASLPVTAGAKWIASKWFRERPYQF